MRTKQEATVEDLYRIPGKAEVVDGEVVPMSPTGLYPGYAGGEIMACLREHAKRTKRGVAVPDSVAFLVNLPQRRSFSPDAAFYIGPLTQLKFAQGAPVFAAEVRRESEYGPAAERKMAEKRADYVAAGTLVVWDVDLLSEGVVHVYRATEASGPTIYRPGEIAEAEPTVPGWIMPVDDLFIPEGQLS